MVALCAAPLALPARSIAQVDVARQARDLIVRMDLEAAGRVLVAADPDSPPIALERARLAIYEMDCDAASAILARPDVQRVDDGAALADVAHGCARATAALVVNRDDGLGIDVQWQDERDAPLAPLLSETVAQARDMLSRDLGVDWPRPTRIVVVRDSLSLSAMTGLPYSSAKTTGTVAVAKWGRVTLLSPRATPYGYVWRDTIAHELTHLAVTRASGDRAPLWLQEGVAKYEELRWRPPKPFDDWPPADAVAKRGIESGHGYALDKLGPSIAMLPSAEAATVAFAEVTSFVRFYLMHEGDGALPKLLHAIKDARNVDAALLSASGADIKAWDARWRAYLATRPGDARLGLIGLDGRTKDDKKHVAAARDERIAPGLQRSFFHVATRKARRRSSKPSTQAPPRARPTFVSAEWGIRFCGGFGVSARRNRRRGRRGTSAALRRPAPGALPARPMVGEPRSMAQRSRRRGWRERIFFRGGGQ